MAVTSSIKFNQGGLTAAAGRALVGGAGVAVVCSNGSNANVASWEWSLLDVPRGSLLPLGAQATNATFLFTPDVVGGCYRVQLTVVGSDATTAMDVRNFAVANGRGFFLPSFQAIPNVDYTSDEFNFDGQVRSWAKVLEDTVAFLSIGLDEGARIVRVPFEMATADSTVLLPAGAWAFDTRIRVLEAYDNNAAITAIVNGTSAATVLRIATDNDPTTVGDYVSREWIPVTVQNGGGVVRVLVGGSPTQGSGELMVSYVGGAQS